MNEPWIPKIGDLVDVHKPDGTSIVHRRVVDGPRFNGGNPIVWLENADQYVYVAYCKPSVTAERDALLDEIVQLRAWRSAHLQYRRGAVAEDALLAELAEIRALARRADPLDSHIELHACEDALEARAILVARIPRLLDEVERLLARVAELEAAQGEDVERAGEATPDRAKAKEHAFVALGLRIAADKLIANTGRALSPSRRGLASEPVSMRPLIYISSSWKQRDRVRAFADQLRAGGFDVYDFTDPSTRKTQEIPPERFPDLFDPARHRYGEYLEAVPEWRAAVEANRDALVRCDGVALLLPCGNDAHADWSLVEGLRIAGRRKFTVVVGHPAAGERTPTHLWADARVEHEAEAIAFLRGRMTRG